MNNKNICIAYAAAWIATAVAVCVGLYITHSAWCLWAFVLPMNFEVDVKEENEPYKPKEYEDRYYACKCGNPLLHKWDEYPTKLMPKSRGLSYCLNCGQKLDWE